MPKKQTIHQWLIPYRTTLEGYVCVEAPTAEEAREIAESESLDLEPGASMTNWEVIGEPELND